MKLILAPKTLIIIFLVLIASQTVFAFSQERIFNKSFLQPFVDDYLSTNTLNENISTNAMTLQCNGFNSSQPTSAIAGTLGFLNYPLTKQDSLFQIGSVTKSFVSVVLLQLAADTKYHFNLDDEMQKWFPEYPNWYGITVKQLLNMTSGIPSYTSDPAFTHEYANDPYKSRTPSEIINYVYNKPLAFSPGSQWQYSNTNYILLGLVIRKITGHDAAIEIKERIIDKLHLKNTYFITDFPPVSLRDRLVHGYIYENDDPMFKEFPLKTDVTDFNYSWMNSAGGIISNTEDINKYIRALFIPGNLLTSGEIKQLTTTVKTDAVDFPDYKFEFGLGIFKVQNIKDKKIFYWYQGGTLGFRFNYFYYPSRSLSIVFALNSRSSEDNSSAFVIQNIVPKVWDKCAL